MSFLHQQTFGIRLGSSIPIRRPSRSLGFTPTGATPTAGCTEFGTRMIEDQGGYTPVGCPTGPDCYDIIDADTGTVVIKGIKGTTSGLPVCWQYGYSDPGAAAPVPPPSTIPTPPAEESLPPISIDIQASTPGYQGGTIPTQPLPQQKPIATPAPEKKEPVFVPPTPKAADNKLDTGSVVGIGAVALAALAAAFFGK